MALQDQNEQTVLITGATGNIGSALVKELAAKGVQLRLLVRDIEKAKPFAQSNVEVAIGDLNNSESVRTALNGVDKAFLLPPTLQNQFELERNFIDRAKAAT